MARLRLFGPARQAAGTSGICVPAKDVAEVIEQASARFGASFSAILATSQLWLNGDQTTLSAPVSDDDEVAVIPPVSGG